MELSITAYRLICTRTLSHELIVALGIIVLIEFVEFYNAYQL